MLSMNDLKPGVVINHEDQPYVVLESSHLKVAQRRPVMQTKLRNLKSGKVLSYTFQQSDRIQEADIERKESIFKYRTKSDFFFIDQKGNKYKLDENSLTEKTNWLVPGTQVTLVFFKEELIQVDIPIKMVLKVKDAPPGLKGDSAQGANKEVVLETGASIKTPLFIESGDKIEVNTQTGQYVRRIN